MSPAKKERERKEGREGREGGEGGEEEEDGGDGEDGEEGGAHCGARGCWPVRQTGVVGCPRVRTVLWGGGLCPLCPVREGVRPGLRVRVRGRTSACARALFA